jgi:hypothetical protein
VLTDPEDAPVGPAVVEIRSLDTALEGVQIIGHRRAGIWLDGERGGASVDLSGVLVRDARAVGISAGLGAVVRGADVAVLGTRQFVNAMGESRYGHGLFAADDARVELERALFDGNRAIAVFAATGSEITLTSSIVRRTMQAADGRFGRGVGAELRGRVTLRESVVEDSYDCGAAVGTGGSLTLSGSVVRRTLPTPARPIGCGVSVTEGSVTIERTVIEASHSYAVGALGADTILTIADSRIAHTAASASGSGIGLLIEGGAQAQLARTRLVDHVDTGILVRSGSTIDILDVAVVGTRSDPTDGDHGTGIELSGGAVATGARLSLERNREAGLVAFGEGTMVTLSDVSITGTLARECATNACAGFGLGVGAGAHDGATLALTRFEIVDSALAGLQSIGGALAMTDGRVADTELGAILDTESATFDRVTFDVRDRNIVRERIAEPPLPSTFAM